jgi:hypothetical protein
VRYKNEFGGRGGEKCDGTEENEIYFFLLKGIMHEARPEIEPRPLKMRPSIHSRLIIPPLTHQRVPMWDAAPCMPDDK